MSGPLIEGSVPLLYVGTLVITLALIRAAIKEAAPNGIRGVLARTLIGVYPGSINELLRRRRLSFWYKTSRSPYDQRVWGYADCHSIRPGESFRIMMSAGPGIGAVSGHLEIFRIGHYENSDRKLLWQSDRIDIDEYGINNTAAALGPGWPAALLVTETSDWVSGYHSVDFVEADGTRHEDIAFLVITDPQHRADVLVKLATATYQAYNRWGGHNFYLYETPTTLEGNPLGPFESDLAVNRGDMVSFDRPTASEFWEWEYYYVLWLERLAREEGFTVAYATNFDFSHDPAFTFNCKLLISVGHDEYWSKEEFDYAYDRIFRQGGNMLFLGANTAYWQIRYADVNAPDGNADKQGRQMVCYKSTSDPVRYRSAANPDMHVTARFRENARRPEIMLSGIAYQSNLLYRRQEEPRYSYYVVSADLPFFRGTDYQAGDYVADVVGHEWDNRDPEAEYACVGESRVPATERLWREGTSHIACIPRAQIKTVFAADVMDVAGRKGHAEAVYFESDAGGRVFSSGTNRWTWGLGKPGFVQEKFSCFNRNLVLHFMRNSGTSAGSDSR